MKPALLVVGLGNPGTAYETTRHNLGFIAVETAAKVFGSGTWQEKPKFLSHIMEGEIDGIPAFFVKPTTFMNRSGEAIAKLLSFYDLHPEWQLLVCCDDIDISVGTFRLRLNGGPGTHNGLKSVQEIAGEDFPRLRIGIGPKPEKADLASWVLSAISKAELAELKHVLLQVPDIVRNHAQHVRAGMSG